MSFLPFRLDLVKIRDQAEEKELDAMLIFVPFLILEEYYCITKVC